MKTMPRFRFFRLKAFILSIVAAVSLAVYFPILGQTRPEHKTEKNPKLSTPLVLLSLNVKQASVRPTMPEDTVPPARFSKETLPKPLQDAIHAGQMQISNKGEVQVYIEMNGLTSQNLDELRSYGVTVQIIGEPKPDKSKGEVLTKVSTVQGLLPVTMINQVSALPFVRYIRLPDYGFTNAGSVDTQGDEILQATQARAHFGIDGTGVKIGVISGGIGGVFATGCTTCGPTTAIPSPIMLGDLPSATGTRNSSGTLTSVTGGIIAQSFPSSSPDLEDHLQPDGPSGVNAEGTAMLEIVHDLAPSAQLYFANGADGTSLSFEQAVDWVTANTDVAVDDVSFPIPPFDGTNVVSTNTASDLNTDAKPIRGYFTAVGNDAYNHYEQDYSSQITDTLSCSNGTSESGGLQHFIADGETTFATAPSVPAGISSESLNPFFLPAGATVKIWLTWNDPLSGSNNDYDMFLYLLPFGSSMQVPVYCSINPQTGTQPPFETITYTNNGVGANPGNGQQYLFIYILNVNNGAAPRMLDMFVTGISDTSPNLGFYTPSGSVPAESDAGGSPVSAVSVGAVDQMQCPSPGNCTGSVESYSSQGPTESTPQAAARMKPDVTATDDVTVTGAGGFGRNGPNADAPVNCTVGESPCYFAGTSAAAPHVAAIAALALQAAPCLLSSSNVNQPAIARAQLRNFITGTATSLPGIAETVPNDIEGYGVVNALAAIGATLPNVNAGPDQVVNATGANGATVNLNGSATDPDSCPLTLKWTGPCGTASMAKANVTCPIGNNVETLTASNGGVTTSLPTSTAQITVSDFTLTGPQSAVNVQPGQSASYTISVGEAFGIFTNPVALSCSGLPASASCSFSPAMVTPGDGFTGSVNSTLTVSTAAASSAVFSPFEWRAPNPYLLLWIAALLAFATVRASASKIEKRRSFFIAACGLAVCLVLPIVSCGGGSGTSREPSQTGTPAGTYTVTVNGISNQLQHSTAATLTVE